MSSASVRAPADLKAEITRRRIYLYEIAPPARLNPLRLGQMLSGKLPMPDDVAQRVEAALGEWEGGHGD